ncbi:MAG: toxin-antitoxin system HicB family antitoxin [Acidobacteria bacterium]|nr:toxin-antitoxin system HicB family antitoxin [Acidobacteriota bacterium]
MSALSLRLPNSLHERARDLAKREGISINQLVSSALAEKMSALLTEEYLEPRARRGNRSRFFAALAQVPAIEPELNDRLPAVAPPKRLQPTKTHRRPRKRPRSARRLRR